MLEKNGIPAEDIEWQYRYDWLDRLVRVSRGVGGATPDICESIPLMNPTIGLTLIFMTQ